MSSKRQANNDDMALLKQALLKIEQLEAKVADADRAKHEPIAVIGMGCRLPGGVNSPEEFWRVLANGTDLVTEVPADRWNADAYYEPAPGAAGKMYSKAGAFLDDVAGFDPQFFGIAPREAKSLDPQQRLLLDVSWEALENAGQSPEALAGSATGVFFGIGGTDYQQLQMHQQDLELLDTYHASGVAHSVAAGRVSYALGLTGPSVAIDTACSSSLVAIHYACQSLRNGECRSALAGGVNLMLAPFSNIAFCQSSMLSPNGRCATFDASADGFVQGEGCGVIVLKRLRDALEDGDRIEAVIRGSAINQDGASSGLTAPNGPAQEKVILAALADGGLSPKDVSFVEAHGSGTPLGDPIEVQALAAALGRQRSKDDPLRIGSVKTNVGHLATAAGVAGVIKVVLAMRAKQIPPHLHFDKPNPHIPWAQLPVEVTTELEPWSPTVDTRVAGVSGFGFSGTNVHLVLEEAPDTAEVDREARPADPAMPLVLSAKTGGALRALASSYAADLAARPESELPDVVYTANTGRAHFKHRLIANGGSAQSLAASLENFAGGHPDAHVKTAVLQSPDAPRVAFLFAGIGSAHHGMGRQLFESEAVFRQAIERCNVALGSRLGRPLESILYPDAGDADAAGFLDEARYACPAMFAVEYALAMLWRHWGVRPWAVMGYGTGEYVAACVAGALSLDDAIGLAAERGRLMEKLASDGAMAAIFASPDEVRAAVEPVSEAVSIAAINGPRNVVVSGTRSYVDRLCEELSQQGIRCVPLGAWHALQSPQVEAVLDELEEAASRIVASRPEIGIVSGITGENLSPTLLGQSSYWRAQARDTIRFSDAVDTLRERDVSVFVEIGPDAVLTGLGASATSAPGGVWISSMRSGSGERAQMLAGLGTLFLGGAEVSWQGAFSGGSHRRIVLPTYPFERKTYWIDGLEIRSGPGTRARAAEHPLLGGRVDSPLEPILFCSEFGPDLTPDLYEHVVHGIVVVPAAAILEMFIAAGQSYFGNGDFDLLDVSITEALTLSTDGRSQVILVLTPGADNQASVEVFSRQGEAAPTAKWRAHAAGTLVSPRSSEAQSSIPAEPAEAIMTRCRVSIDVERLYRGMWARGLQFGRRFRGLNRLLCGEGEAVGEIDSSVVSSERLYRFDPPALDACIQVVSASLPGFDPEDTDSDIFMPIGIDRVRISSIDASPAVSHARLDAGALQSGETLSVDLRVYDAEGRTLLELEGLHLKRADAETLSRATSGDVEDLLYRIDWRLAGHPVPGKQPFSDLPAPDAIGARVRPSVEPLCAEHGVDIYESLSADLDALCASYIVDALHKLGVSFETGKSLAVDDLVEKFGIDKRHRRLVERMLDILCEEKVLTRDGDRWTVRDEPAFESSSVMVERLMEEYSGCDAELLWTRRCGDSLAEALCGDADPHELLFPAGDTTLATTVYSKTPLARLFNDLTAEAVAAIVAGLPADQHLDVLEIGAGTGATTAAMLEALPADRSRYTFSDIGPAFVNQARRRFADYANADFKVLDIEKSPALQGFGDGQFDVVVASNVLHATANLHDTLDRVAGLLAPGGLLILLEVTAQQRWFDLTVGLTDGWWRFEDSELRPGHPLLSGAQWTELLRECGFDATAVVPETRHPAFDQAMILARKSVRAATRAQAAGESWYVMTDSTGVGASLARELEGQGANCVLIHKSSKFEKRDSNNVLVDPHGREHFERLMTEIDTHADGPRRFVYLWALDAPDDHEPSVGELTADQAEVCGAALWLVQALAKRAFSDARLALVTRGAQLVLPGSGSVAPAQSTLWGLNKAITLEHPELHSIAVDLDPSLRATAEETRALIEEIRNRSEESEIAMRRGSAYTSRLVRAAMKETTAIAVPPKQASVITKPSSGLLEDLCLEAMDRPTPGEGEVEIRVLASGMNFRDVLVALDVHHDFDSIGSECAGRVLSVGAGVTDLVPGDEVVAVAPRSLATHAVANAHLTVRKPRSVSFVDAVTLPIAFLTADYALNHVGRMAAGDVVLIHAAAGGVGMAALQLARQAGATVLATAGSSAKRRYLRQLGVEHVMSSRTYDFTVRAMEVTDGRGVDIVLNGLTGEFIEKGLGILAPGGRFLELGKSDVWDPIRARAVNPDAEYHAVDLTGDMLENAQTLRPMLEAIMQRVEGQELSPLPWTSFPLESAGEAFRFMEQARHIGKVVLTQPDPIAQSAGDFRDDGTYLIVGGLSGLGERVAEWAVDQGARHLVLAGRSDPQAETLAKIAVLEERGANVSVARCDVSREDDVRRVLDDITTNMPPLRGVFHSAGLLSDGLLMQQDWKRFEYVMAPKVAGAWLLHTLTRDMSLDFFVLFSSVASVLGGSGAANHSAANAFLDSLAHSRRQKGLPALSINWGAWSEVGAAVRGEASQHVASQGLGFITPAQGLEALNRAMSGALDQVAVLSMDWPVFFARDPEQAQRSLLSGLFAETRSSQPTALATDSEERAEVASDFIERLEAAYPNKRLQLIEDHVLACAGQVLGLDAESMDRQQPLSEMGMDSLMAVELRNTLRRSIGKQLPATLLFDYPTVTALSRHLANEVLVAEEPAATPVEAAEFDLLESIENLSEEEVDRAFGEQLERG